MAKLALVYGLRLLPADEMESFEDAAVRLKNGKYVAFFRSRFADHIFRATSDDGKTWTSPHATELPNNTKRTILTADLIIVSP